MDRIDIVFLVLCALFSVGLHGLSNLMDAKEDELRERARRLRLENNRMEAEGKLVAKDKSLLQ